MWLLMWLACGGPVVSDTDTDPPDADTDTDCPPAWTDGDLDGYGDPAAPAGCGEGVANDGDCDDAAGSVHPGADELCNGADDDCDGTRDEDALDPSAWWPDADGDGWGDGASVTACDRPSGHAARSGDCDDGDGAVSPDAAEVPSNGADDDCDGADACFADGDGDGWGDAVVVNDDLDCADPGEAGVSGDCDDADAARNPGETEVCGNGIDEDCAPGCGIFGELGADDASATIGDDGTHVISTCGILGDDDADGSPGFYLRSWSSGVLFLFDTAPSGAVTLADAATVLTEDSIRASGQTFAGDVDGDGLSELAAWSYDTAWYVTVGAATSSLEEAVLLQVDSGGTDIYSVDSSPASDVDGDGAADLAIGADGRAGLIFSPGSGTYSLDDADLLVETTRSYGSVTAAGDITGDGQADLVLGDANYHGGFGAYGMGAVWIFDDLSTGVLGESDALARLDGHPSALLEAGSRVLAGGDLTADGYEDLVVAAKGREIYVVSGPVRASGYVGADASYTDPGTGAAWTAVVSSDHDGDGDGDLVASTSAGSARVLLTYGPLATGSFDLSASGSVVEPVPSANHAVACAPGDLDDDSYGDLVVASWTYDPWTDGTGQAFIYLGGSGL
jgi:hypothetical protein